VFEFAEMVKAGATPQRLNKVASDACAKELQKTSQMLKTQLDQDILSCKFLGTEPRNQKLNAKARVLFEWRVKDMGAATSKLFLGPVLYDQSLRTPHVIKMPFLCACLPKAISEHKALPFMQEEKGTVTCRSICLSKQIELVTIKKGTVRERSDMYLLFAQVYNDVWIAVSEKAPCAPKHLEQVKVEKTEGDAGLSGNHENVRKCYAIAHFLAELSRAKIHHRPVDLETVDGLN
jgi:hypothetical protein